ncbi:helix-turn-helix domain-containing protein [Trueperella sp. LYQ141]|uniref:helix-turn-helix domain-containing protein n=1 Tax=Trueperella sp. LYQ141 TaxID=3391058 RepID=UPI003983614F
MRSIRRRVAQNHRNQDLVRKLVQERKNKCLNQEEIAEKLGVSQSLISRIENLELHPRLDQIREYAEAVGCEVHFDVRPVKETFPLIPC